MSTGYQISSRIRAHGKARIDIARRAQSRADWEKLWKPPAYSFPFTWGKHWKQCIEYKVDDFAAEIGFFIDILGLPVIAFDPGYAMFTSPDEDFYFAVVAPPEGMQSTLPDAIRMQFMVADIFQTTRELESRGIAFNQQPEPVASGSRFYVSSFQTPHGIWIDLWGSIEPDDGALTEETDILEAAPNFAIESETNTTEQEILAEDENDDTDLDFEATYEDDDAYQDHLDEAEPDNPDGEELKANTPDPLDKYRAGRIRPANPRQ